MNPKLLVVTALCVTPACWAQDAKPVAVTPPELPASAPTERGEPNVQHIVIEDKGSRIEELRVRGATQRITVTPKIGTSKSYEIITGDGSRNLTDGANSSRGAAGKRVWNVLDF